MKRFFLFSVFLLSTKLFAIVDFSTIDIAKSSFNVSVKHLKRLKICCVDKNNNEGFWQAPLSPSHFAEKVNAIFNQTNEDFEARVFSKISSKRYKKELKMILKKSIFIWAYQHDETTHRIKITPMHKPFPKNTKEFLTSIDASSFIVPLKNLFKQNISDPEFCSKLNRDNNFFPEERYFDNWDSYSFVYVVRKPVIQK